MVQSAHALADFIIKNPKLSKTWWETSNYLACLSVKDEAGLLSLSDKLNSKGIKHVVFREPDIDNQITSIAIEPSEESRKICSNLPLALKNLSAKGTDKNSYKQDGVSQLVEKQSLKLSVAGSTPVTISNPRVAQLVEFHPYLVGAGGSIPSSRTITRDSSTVERRTDFAEEVSFDSTALDNIDGGRGKTVVGSQSNLEVSEVQRQPSMFLMGR